MPYAWLVTTALVAHLLFLVYLAVGGFLAWRWPRTIWLHVLVVLWGTGSVLIGYGCPLTSLERWARERAGQGELSERGFIDHYLTGVVYPERWLVAAQGLVAVLVLVSWVGLVRRARLSPAGRSTPRPDRGGHQPWRPGRRRR